MVIWQTHAAITFKTTKILAHNIPKYKYVRIALHIIFSVIKVVQSQVGIKIIILLQKWTQEFFLSCGSLECSWKNEPCQLKVHYDEGFTLSELPKGEGGGPPKVLWQYSYTQLRTSADDANHLLWLDFGAEDGEKVQQQHYVILLSSFSFITRVKNIYNLPDVMHI